MARDADRGNGSSGAASLRCNHQHGSLLVILGFPIALIIAWAFELTPEGLKRTELADELPKKSVRSRAWIYVVIVAGTISVGVFFLGRYTSSKQSEGAQLPAKSIAMLPFDNLSRDPDNAYFTQGIQNEILTRLSKISDLRAKVTGREELAKTTFKRCAPITLSKNCARKRSHDVCGQDCRALAEAASR